MTEFLKASINCDFISEMRAKLNELKEKRYLTHRIFRALSENLHYEIFKYLDSSDLLTTRGIGLGGYQLTSNTLLRPRISNYLHSNYKLLLTHEEEINYQHARLLFEQTGKNKLNFEGYRLSESNLKYLVQLLKRLPDLHQLILNSTNYCSQSRDFMPFVSCFEVIMKLKSLSLASNNIGLSEIKYLSSNLRFLPDLEYINLDFNPIGDKGLENIARQFKVIPNLQKLSLRNNNIGINGGIQSLCKNLEFIVNLKLLNLSYNIQFIGCNQINGPGAILLAQNIEYIPNLERLYLSANQIGNQGIIALAKVFLHIPKLTHLDISNNYINKIGIEVVSENINFLPKLKYLNISQNQIKEIEIILEMFASKNSNIELLT